MIDFFRVENRAPLPASIKGRDETAGPGLAGITVKAENPHLNRLIVTAYFEPRGLWGDIYWYFFLPFHYLIFTRLIQLPVE